MVPSLEAPRQVLHALLLTRVISYYHVSRVSFVYREVIRLALLLGDFLKAVRHVCVDDLFVPRMSVHPFLPLESSDHRLSTRHLKSSVKNLGL